MLLESRVAHPTSVPEAERLAAEIYGVRAAAKSLPGEYDDNFHLTAQGGREFVLKVMHPARQRPFIDLQCRALEHLASHAPNIQLSRVVPNLRGDLYSEIVTPHGDKRLVWLLTFIRGTVLASVRPHSDELLASLGRLLGEMDRALQSFLHSNVQRDLKWDLSAAGWIEKHLHHIADPSRRGLVEKFLTLYKEEIVPNLPNFRRSVIYGDANDHNVLVSDPFPLPCRVVSVIDFGDMHHGITVSEVAVAAAYAIFGKKDALRAAATVVGGYHQTFPLEQNEIAALYALIGMRLAVSVVNSAQRKTIKDDAYVTISEAPAWKALEEFAKVHPRFAHYAFRDACGLTPVPQGEKIYQWLKKAGSSTASLFDVDLRSNRSIVLDLSVGSAFLGADPQDSQTGRLSAKIFDRMREENATIAIGRYNEPRLLYTSRLFGSSENPLDERRTIHLGIDVFATAGTSIRAPFDGEVHILANNAAPLDYGPLVILRHDAADAGAFFTLYGHLDKQTLADLKIGQCVSKGEVFARLGDSSENGGWPPHLHFQLILDLLDLREDFPGVALDSQRDVWMALSPDPNLLIGFPADKISASEPSFRTTLSARCASFSKNLSLSYDSPLKIVRGWMQFLYDDSGRAFLDFYNNVPLVGHSHPRVVRATQEQLALLNTNTRYLSDVTNHYAQRLTALLPESLCVCFFVNSGSEANELALRLARAHTRREDVVVLEHAYHGNTSTLIDISAYKFDGPGGSGCKPWVHVAPIADDYRGKYRREDPDAGSRYAAEVGDLLDRAQRNNHPVGAFIAETLPSVGGQIVFPPGYLREVYRNVRAAGGVCIADEVQVGFGRLGTHFWGFESQEAVPDIVVLGKPIGNGFPLGAVVTTLEIAQSFANGMEYFSTFGGNPVASAAGLAVLDVLQEECLQENALRVGAHLKNSLQSLQRRFALIGDVRGAGLFLGLDLVADRVTRKPAHRQATYVVNRLRERGILTGTDGPHHNVIKLRPPLIISEAHADLFVNTLAEVLEEDAASVPSTP
jgi:4-aminobutyrate aminotransferase-like enzyme/Ser/Thr protein kinase RdoA (MazF antagonist)